MLLQRVVRPNISARVWLSIDRQLRRHRDAELARSEDHADRDLVKTIYHTVMQWRVGEHRKRAGISTGIE
jgi:hypothetical protein